MSRPKNAPVQWHHLAPADQEYVGKVMLPGLAALARKAEERRRLGIIPSGNVRLGSRKHLSSSLGGDLQ